jgi:hypothetical protein
MEARYTIFWTATSLAATISLMVLYEFLFGLEAHFPIVNLPGLILAAGIWVVGWVCRYAL